MATKIKTVNGSYIDLKDIKKILVSTEYRESGRQNLVFKVNDLELFRLKVEYSGEELDRDVEENDTLILNAFNQLLGSL